MIQIINNGDNSYDIFNDELNLKITNELYDSIKEDNNYFITEKNGEFGIVSKSGIIYLNCEYQSISVCNNSDFIIYEKDTQFGILNTGGKSLKPICTSVFEVEHLNDDGSTTFIIEILYDHTMWNSLSGMHKELFASLIYIGHGLIEFRKINNSVSKKRIKQLHGLINSKGIILFAQNRTTINSFPDINRLVINSNFKFQIFDFQLNIIKDGFSYLSGFYSGASVAVKNNQCGLIDINGDWIPEYQNLDTDEKWWNYYYNPCENGFVPIKRNGLYGLVNYNKKLFLDPISINEIIFYNDGFTPITISNGLTGIMDKEFNWVIEPTLKDLYFPFEGYNDIKEYCTTTGFPFIYQSPDNLKFGLISCTGKWVCNPIYDNIYVNDYYDLPHSYLFYLKFDQDGKKGIINIRGEEIFKGIFDWNSNSKFDPFLYDESDFRLELNNNHLDSIIPEQDIFFPVIKDNKVGYFDAKGNFYLGDLQGGHIDWIELI